jgi:murein DD-endopeptidase MepM/ murein hydrolase activator NlpD
MRLRIGLMALLAACLACNLGSPEYPTPTRSPTQTSASSSATSIALEPTIQSTSGTTSSCTPRTDWPTMTVGEGDTLSTIAERVGSSVDDLVAANCLSEPNAIVSGQSLYVPVAVASNSSGGITDTGNNPVVPAQNCGSDQWFFVFYPAKQDSSCPGPVITSNAAGENFEGGRVYWYEAMPGAADTRGIIYVIYNDGTWESFLDTWDSSQPSNDPNIAPPPGRFQPERGIGKLWREQTGVRGKLGWAYEPESAFMGRRQSPVGNTGGAYSYIDHGWRNLVLRLYSGSLGANRWEVAGHY